jgi:hypothetical protein
VAKEIIDIQARLKQLDNHLKQSIGPVEKKNQRDRLDELECEKAEEINANIRTNRDLKIKYAQRAYRYLCMYSVAALGLLIASGFEGSGFSLHWSVLVTLVGSTAISAIGLVRQVINGLFGSK